MLLVSSVVMLYRRANIEFSLFRRRETMTALVAFAWGLLALTGLSYADVSHLQQAKSQYSSSGQTFVANNGQFVRQSFNTNGSPTFSSRQHNAAASGNNESSKDTNNRYWWLRNTDNSKQTKSTSNQNNQNTLNSVSNYVSGAGCNGCASQRVRLNRQNTNTQNQPHNTASYIRQNSFKHSQPNYQSQTASVSGTNNHFDSGRIQQQSCDASSACVAQRFCNSGFIDASYESRAQRSSVSFIS